MDASPCPLDTKYANQIAALLAPPSPQAIQEYYEGLIQKEKCHAVRIEINTEHGKGVFSNRKFEEEELIFKDQILVAAQHSSNKVDCFVCSSCFRFIGSVELQIGRKLYLQSLGLLVKKECCHQTFSNEKTASSSSESQNEDDLLFQENSDNAGQSSYGENSPSKEVLESLMNEKLSLPFSKQFSLPSIVPCPGGCEEEYYCSKVCADSNWESMHSLLCTGKSSCSLRQAAIVKFTEHANSTNDIFILAAKVISFTILRYRRLKQSLFENSKRPSSHNSTNDCNLSLLLEAWKPIAMGFKRRWWDSIALPEDMDSCVEALFREEMRDMAFSEEAEKLTRPFLDALGDDYSVCCQGTAFYPIQSCINHSCCPNAKAFKREEDIDGHTVIIAVNPISIGEEITISYIDEDLPYEERQALLADYGFKCSCRKCRKEQSSR
ncbi:histone-lysine N-methyltransferase ATXR2 isoform X2 [Dendrobium catenatum]|uniref:histone-lysine N-methyltransferase ATXR2 isoform X2 n=1 Tax=Dendrobium catenatum TaxID=906689 RepID=UPI00109F61C2|nr:histone-lysine N-methyltransferase ATXR2 isoform X2 [Dendrobium catenatum]